VAGAVATVTRYVALRSWVFVIARRPRRAATEPPALNSVSG
jgi:hypothetical protein